jgi:hypothetical protein
MDRLAPGGSGSDPIPLFPVTAIQIRKPAHDPPHREERKHEQSQIPSGLADAPERRCVPVLEKRRSFIEFLP